MQITNTNFQNSNFWEQLLTEQKLLSKVPIIDFFKDKNRSSNFSLKLLELNLLFDFSKQHITKSVLNILYNAANHCGLKQKIEDLFQGKKINITELRSVEHVNLRMPDPEISIKANLAKMQEIAENLYNNITDLLCLGIGGSYLGPKMVCEALTDHAIPSAKNIKLHFIANHDLQTLTKILKKLNINTTRIIVSSKSFTTVETINNANFIKEWANNDLSKFFAITSNVNKAIEFGIFEENILSFSENIGGRYSVWSVVGLPIVIKLGIDNFKKLLHGAYIIDQHFRNTDFADNIPVNMGLISVWNINFMQYKSLAVIPYLDDLEFFPEYLQQLAMESNGKSIDIFNKPLNYDTSEIIFGGVGCNVQHSFMQMLHQGTQIIPVDFIVAAEQKKFLFANCLAQSQALMQGSNNLDPNAKFKNCPGNRPSNTILFKQLTPELLGGLIALYEHKIFVQSVMWGINAFDQWGVELGKHLAKNILKNIDLAEKTTISTNSSEDDLANPSVGLIQEYLKLVGKF